MQKTQDYILFAAAIGTQIDADIADLKYGFYLLRKWRIPGNSELHRRNPLTSIVEVGIRKNNQCNCFLSAVICYNRGNQRSIFLQKKQDYILSAIQQFWFADTIGTRMNADMADLKYGFYLLRKWRIPKNSELHRRNPLTSLVEVGIRKNNQCNCFLSVFICYNRGNPRSIFLQKKTRLYLVCGCNRYADERGYGGFEIRILFTS